jgi:hypothetical protein
MDMLYMPSLPGGGLTMGLGCPPDPTDGTMPYGLAPAVEMKKTFIHT